jgi:UDP-N-acetylmuramate dehydrogenase
MEFERDKPLHDFTTFHIGGPARYFIEVTEIKILQDVIRYAFTQGIPYFILGKGSNCLFDDRGFNGLVILNKIDFLLSSDPGVFQAGAGFSFSLLGVRTAKAGWKGLEFACGIPGSVGGAVFMNAGANNGTTFETLTSVCFVEETGESLVYSKESLEYGYRYSSFQKLKGAIASATFQLAESADARKTQLDIIQYRKKTQPYGDHSAGCVFRNPDCRHAGALIDMCGLKGLRVGGAMVSPIHANFIVNVGGATSNDVLTLIEIIQSKVKEKTGIELESEVRVIAFQAEEYASFSR